MTTDERHRRMDAARIHAELTVQDLWLAYLALGGTDDAFTLDGYLQGLIPLEAFQQDILAQSLNEALEDGYRAHHIPLSTTWTDHVDGDGDEDRGSRLRQLIEDLLNHGPTAEQDPASPPPDQPEPPDSVALRPPVTPAHPEGGDGGPAAAV